MSGLADVVQMNLEQVLGFSAEARLLAVPQIDLGLWVMVEATLACRSASSRGAPVSPSLWASV